MRDYQVIVVRPALGETPIRGSGEVFLRRDVPQTPSIGHVEDETPDGSCRCSGYPEYCQPWRARHRFVSTHCQSTRSKLHLRSFLRCSSFRDSVIGLVPCRGGGELPCFEHILQGSTDSVVRRRHEHPETAKAGCVDTIHAMACVDLQGFLPLGARAGSEGRCMGRVYQADEWLA